MCKNVKEITYKGEKNVHQVYMKSTYFALPEEIIVLCAVSPDISNCLVHRVYIKCKQVGTPTRARAGFRKMGWSNMGLTHMAW